MMANGSRASAAKGGPAHADLVLLGHAVAVERKLFAIPGKVCQIRTGGAPLPRRTVASVSTRLFCYGGAPRRPLGDERVGPHDAAVVGPASHHFHHGVRLTDSEDSLTAAGASRSGCS
jgi:hypothetical protein